MLTFINLLIQAPNKPRHYIEASKYHRLHVLLMSLIPIVLFSISNYIETFPDINGVLNQISNVRSHLPQFYYENEKLLLEDSQQPIYYRSDDIQVVIDPTIESNHIFNTIPIPKEKYNHIDHTKVLNLFIFQEQAYLQTMDQIYEISNPSQTIKNTVFLKKEITQFLNNKQWLILLFYAVILIISAIIYTLIITLATLISKFMNRFLSHKLAFNERFKIMVAISVLPFSLTHFISILIGQTYLPIALLITIMLYIYYKAFQDQTLYVEKLKKSISIQPVNIIINEQTIEEEQRKQNIRLQTLQKLKKEFLDKYHLSESTTSENNVIKDELNKLQKEIIHLEITIQTIQNEIDKYQSDETSHK